MFLAHVNQRRDENVSQTAFSSVFLSSEMTPVPSLNYKQRQMPSNSLEN